MAVFETEFQSFVVEGGLAARPDLHRQCLTTVQAILVHDDNNQCVVVKYFLATEF